MSNVSCIFYKSIFFNCLTTTDAKQLYIWIQWSSPNELTVGQTSLKRKPCHNTSAHSLCVREGSQRPTFLVNIAFRKKNTKNGIQWLLPELLLTSKIQTDQQDPLCSFSQSCHPTYLLTQAQGIAFEKVQIKLLILLSWSYRWLIRFACRRHAWQFFPAVLGHATLKVIC